MKHFENQEIHDEDCPIRRGPMERVNSLQSVQNHFIDDVEIVGCTLIGTGLATYGEPIHRSTAKNVRLKSCALNGFFGIGAIFDDVTIDGLRTSRAPVILFGCALRHVVVSGTCGRFILNRELDRSDKRRNDLFDADNRAFYENLDWALDISQLNAAAFEIRGSIPARLIRRNPEEQFIMTREVALSGDWRKHGPFGAVDIGISIFLDSLAEDNVFVAPRRSKYFKEDMEFFTRLKQHGLVT